MGRRSTDPDRAAPVRPQGAQCQGRGHLVGRGVLSLLAVLVVTAGGPLPVAAAGAPPPPLEAEVETEYARAPVMFDGESLFQVRGVMAYPAEKRAQVIAGRIQAVAADRSVPVDSLRIVQTEHGSDILAGDRFLMTVSQLQ